MFILVKSRGCRYYSFKISLNQLTLFPHILVVLTLGHTLGPPRMRWENVDVCAPSHPHQKNPLEEGTKGQTVNLP